MNTVSIEDPESVQEQKEPRTSSLSQQQQPAFMRTHNTGEYQGHWLYTNISFSNVCVTISTFISI